MDDGSTDQGAQICKELAMSDDRIRLHRLGHGGVSRARNRGLEIASGEYIFFLDSDDTIHPRLLGESVRLAETEHADMVFCHYRKLKTEQMEQVMAEDLRADILPRWQVTEGEEAEEWKYVRSMSEIRGIGGKMIRRSFIGGLRFDESLRNGEDTWFLYQLISKRIRMVRVFEKWYYYRTHEKSITHSLPGETGQRYFEGIKRIRDEEYRKKRWDFAVRWEKVLILQMERNYTVQRGLGNCQSIKEIAVIEKKYPLFKNLCFSDKVLYYFCFYCHPLYKIVNRMLPTLLKIKEAIQ